MVCDRKGVLLMIKRKARKARVFMRGYIIRKVDKIVKLGVDITVCLPGATL